MTGIEAHLSARPQRPHDRREVVGRLIDPGVIGATVLERDGDPELGRPAGDLPQGLARQPKRVGLEPTVAKVAGMNHQQRGAQVVRKLNRSDVLADRLAPNARVDRGDARVPERPVRREPVEAPERFRETLARVLGRLVGMNVRVVGP